ncbi:hypothetical protein F1D05_04785 [Kribbella qitaiheensis]|uniref:Uncharacterized protein n=1 Tax=Kribbella qitaiheensis TaxID=1544730 RepID=A0A7G6WTP5_9ACTN|nr:hypothetical protein [Kribbella qitaiheensis]QNE17360.1 hypothetical protein F1D05_04785 [Kribbella qitaiheensis]
MYRWVRYEAPVMVCVTTDEHGEHHVVNVIVGDEHLDLRLARDDQGTPLVYDEQMERLTDQDSILMAAVSEAEDRQWPQPTDWESGPDALRYPGLYDPIENDDQDNLDVDLEPVDFEQPAR